jgi:hypothetical protein
MTYEFRVPVAFPVSSGDITSIDVFDGQGKCNFSVNPIGLANRTQLGWWYKDYENNQIVVCPRPMNQFASQFYIQAIFTYPFDSANRSSVSFWEPYRYTLFAQKAVTPISNKTLPAFNYNLTDTFQIVLILPSGAEPVLPSEGKIPTSDITGDNKRTITYTYNSPISEPTNTLPLTFDVVFLRDFFIQQEITLILFVLPFIYLAIVYLFAKPKSRLTFTELVPVGYLISRVIEDGSQYWHFQSLGGAFVLWMILELSLATIFIVVSIVAIVKRQDFRIFGKT